MVDENYYKEDSDLEIERVREDFKFIWSNNVVECELIRETNPQEGDYFADAANIKINRKIWINIQGTTTDHYKRMVAGIITPESSYHCFVNWDEDIENMDIIRFGNYYFRIANFNKSLYRGQFCFMQFDILKVGKRE